MADMNVAAPTGVPTVPPPTGNNGSTGGTGTPVLAPGTPGAAGAAALGSTPAPRGSGGADGAHAGTADHNAQGTGGHDGAHGAEPINPPSNNKPESQQTPADRRFMTGTVGPVVPEGDAKTVKIPDGPGFDGKTGREQNGNDKKQNNYSVTDANFNPQLGLLAANPDTGKPLNYNEHTGTYNAAGFLKSTAEYYARHGRPEYLAEYNKIVANQNRGSANGQDTGTILGASGYVMGLFKTSDEALEGVDVQLLRQMAQRVPGSNRSGFEYVKSSEDVTGQAWARMHHPESAWDMYYGLVDAGVPGETALKFAGDDGVSGSGRLNGYNNQDGNNGFNAGEVEIWKEAAEYERQTGIPVVQIMMSGHDHTGLDASAKTDSNADKLLGIPAGTSPAQRAAMIRDGLLSGRLDEPKGNGGTKKNEAANNDNDTADEANTDTEGGGGGEKANRRVTPLDYRVPSYFLDPNAAHPTGVDPRLFDDPNGPNMKLVQNKYVIPGSVGPIVAKGQAQTIKVPDGKGFFGLEGREQNDGDKAQNNYSVTDANFNPLWGLAGDKNGEPLNYVQQIQLYHSAGYLKTFSPEVYEQLVALQDAGKVSILDAAGVIMGLYDAPEAAEALGAERIAEIKSALTEAGIGVVGQDARIPAKIPGTSMDAKTYVTSPKDASGQDWARMHHPESAMEMLKALLEAGVPEQMAFVLAGDDGVSGAGRLNGFNNQDGEDSFNADESAVFRLAAEYERQTGIPVVQIMMSGHDHTGLDDSAKTDPKINKILGQYGFQAAAGDTPEAKALNRQASPQRAAALSQALLASDPGIDIANLDQHQFKNKSLLKAMDGVLTPFLAPRAAATTGAAMVAGGGGVAGYGAGAAMTGAQSALAGHAH